MRRLIIISLLFLTPIASANTQATKAMLDPKQAEAMEKATTPGEQHKMLQNYVGNWSYTSKWWTKPDSEPEVSTGNATFESIMDGRFVEQRFTGTSMGKPFEGRGFIGYDNVKKQYTTVWLDNFSTGIVKGTGEFNKAANAVIDKGSFSCPLTPTGSKDYRAVWSLPANDSFRYEFFSKDEKGKEYKMMEIVYTKAS